MKNLTTILLIVGISMSLNAQKYGYLNTEELIKSLPEVSQANTKIEALRDSLTKVAQSMITELQNKYKDLESRVDQIPPAQLEKEKQKLQGEEQNIHAFDQKSQQLIYERSNALLAPIQEKINQAIQSVAAEQGYTYIFDTSLGNILYVDKTLDISSLVKAKL